MSVVDPLLRLSAQRALLGAICPEVRLVKVRRDDDLITFFAICDPSLSAGAEQARQLASTEIIADFPSCNIRDSIIRSADPLPREDILDEGWVFERAESGS